MSDVPRGPGHTKYYEKDGVLYRRLHNDQGWVNPVDQQQSMHPNVPLSAERIAQLMQEAYERGRREQQLIIQTALGIAK
jgi:hypothetical protein